MWLPFSDEKSGAIALAQPGPRQAGRPAGRQAGSQSDEIVLDLEIFKIIYRMKYSSFRYA